MGYPDIELQPPILTPFNKLVIRPLFFTEFFNPGKTLGTHRELVYIGNAVIARAAIRGMTPVNRLRAEGLHSPSLLFYPLYQNL